jgi:hypothetical protein
MPTDPGNSERVLRHESESAAHRPFVLQSQAVIGDEGRDVLGYRLYGGPAVTFNGEQVIVARALIWPDASEAPCRTRAGLRRRGTATFA